MKTLFIILLVAVVGYIIYKSINLLKHKSEKSEKSGGGSKSLFNKNKDLT